MGQVAQPVPAPQIIKVYRGKFPEVLYRRDAAKLYQQGYHVVSMSYGGAKNPGCLSIFAFGIFAFAGQRKPNNLTVVYEKNA